jgi:hypothetical protein
LASAGISKSIDMALPRFWFLLGRLDGWHNPARSLRQRRTMFEAAAGREGSA